MSEEFPQEYFLKLENNDSFIGRITVNLIGHSFMTEVDIVHKDSKKIYQHVTMIHKLMDKTEAIDRGVQALSNYFK